MTNGATAKQMSNEIRKYELHSVRLDSDVWDAVKKLPKSLNQFLREVLSAGGAYEAKDWTQGRNTIERTSMLLEAKELNHRLKRVIARGKVGAKARVTRQIRPKGDKSR